MDFDPMDRRGFLGVAGGALVCTIAGQKYKLETDKDIRRASAAIPVPPKVAAAKNNPTVSKAGIVGNRKEYWIAAEPVRWNYIPRKRDEMMNTKLKDVGRSTASSFAYRQYTADFAQPMGPASIPGPLIDATVGDTVVVHFRNACPGPVTMHPHGIFYSAEMDGAYKGYYTDPGGFVQKGRTFTYIWECPEGTQGTWLYHDHGPLDPMPLYRGLYGPMVIRDPDEPLPDREYFLGFATASTTYMRELGKTSFLINGRAYTGNTPILSANVGDDVAMHVYGIDNDFHTFHVHGHRWEENGVIIDNKTFGPGDSFRVRFIEDNPGRWLYHCHVFSHLHQGMSGWYNVT
ncbi:MAG TPA: multicopper oxidase domain-containing protein [Solirubrobacterales bacterium]|nr:multicopper oxidase domain-containing protein [Solirubrobacterales bacterium]